MRGLLLELRPAGGEDAALQSLGEVRATVQVGAAGARQMRGGTGRPRCVRAQRGRVGLSQL